MIIENPIDAIQILYTVLFNEIKINLDYIINILNNLIKDFKSDTKKQIIDSFTLFISSILNSQSFQLNFSQNKVKLFPKTFSDVLLKN